MSYVPSNIQFLLGSDHQPVFAVLPYEEYRKLLKLASENQTATPRPSSDKHKTVPLPHGGPGASLDLVRLAAYCIQHDIESIAVNMRAQSYDKFPPNQLNTLDPLIRREFLPQGSPYKNTMQATTELVNSLVDSGLFINAKRHFPGFYRPVNALDVCRDAMGAFWVANGSPESQIELLKE